jgi:hypothetical protein
MYYVYVTWFNKNIIYQYISNIWHQQIEISKLTKCTTTLSSIE